MKVKALKMTWRHLSTSARILIVLELELGAFEDSVKALNPEENTAFTGDLDSRRLGLFYSLVSEVLNVHTCFTHISFKLSTIS